jgi:hypothetical protein
MESCSCGEGGAGAVPARGDLRAQAYLAGQMETAHSSTVGGIVQATAAARDGGAAG